VSFGLAPPILLCSLRDCKHFFQQAINFFVGLFFLRLLELIGAQLLYTIFGSCCLVAVVFVKKYILETKGKSLQEIEIALLAQEADSTY